MDKENRIIVVCGLGRCGSSMLMQMLQAGGLECTGQHPYFEHIETLGQHHDKTWLTRQQGKASKIINPAVYRLTPAEYLFLWMDRDSKECAKSIYKIQTLSKRVGNGMEHKAESIVFNDAAKRKIMFLFNAHRRTKQSNIKYIRKIGRVLELTFEETILSPEKTVKKIQAEIRQPMDGFKMIDVVQSRSIQCQPSMALEIALINDKKQ